MLLKQLFFQKIAQRLGASPPRSPLMIRLNCSHFFTQHGSQFSHFHILTIDLSPPPRTSSYLRASTRLRLLISHSTSLPPQIVPLSKFLMTSLYVICGLGPPNQKSWLRLWLRVFLISSRKGWRWLLR